MKFSDSLSILRKYGDDICKNQDNAISLGWPAFFNKFADILESTAITAELPRLNFKNFWGPRAQSTYQSRISEVFDAIEDFVCRESNDGSFLAGNVEGGVDAMMQNIKNPFCKGFNLVTWTGGANKTFLQLMNTTKLFAVEKDLFNCLTGFTDPPNPAVQQRSEDISDYLEGFCDMWWSYQYIFEGVYSIVLKPVHVKLLVERAIIEHLRNTDDETLRPCLLKHDFSNHEGMKAAVPVAPDVKKVTRNNLLIAKGTSGSALMDKMEFAVWQTWVLDILLVLSKFGYDPDLQNPGLGDEAMKMNPERNQYYFWYLK